MKHTAKSVGLAPAFPTSTPVVDPDAEYPADRWIYGEKGMTYAEFLFAHNVAGFAQDHQLAADSVTRHAKEQTMNQLEAVANLLNDLEATQ